MWKLLAYLGRYGHQSVDTLLAMPSRDVQEMAEAVASIVREESVASKTEE
jgi:hypothetical protein